ncbi:hypothetical protein THIOM_004448 [Candidatus Thiomargarita nelsonii]|uniref:VCBS repeat-containing protein n=1 Tax=Candidatus Thiomargarita nelsonii TaxID=1003181 RepID=A0A176RVY0_9GAMM|nr:hypothetical protein THIOM_004448 [Candidatus Thiomargarita nelsonii]
MPEQTALEIPTLSIWPGFDLFETLPGTKVDFGQVGGPIVPLTGNPALLASENIGPTDTIVKRQQGINPFDQGDVGTVEIELVALSLKSIAPFDVGFLEPSLAGTMADLYVTINALDLPNIPVPDALNPSTGTMTISHENQENAPIQGTFKSELKVYSGLIFVRAGGDLSDPDAWLFHMPDPTAPLILNSDGIWSHTRPVGDAHNAKYPAGSFYIREIEHDGPHPVKPVRVPAIGPGTTSDLIIDFGPGIQAWLNNSAWQHIHPLSADSMVTGDLDGNGQDELIIDFGPGIGIWILLNNSTWVQLHNLSPESMVTGDLDGNGQDDLIIDFGPGIGIWIRLNNSTWVQLYNLSPESMVTGDLDGNGQDEVIIDFGPGIGIWIRLNNSRWVQLHTISPEIMVTGDLDGNGQDEVIIDFGPTNGIWIRMNNSTWVHLHSLSLQGMATGDLDGNGQDDLIIDFGPPFGIWIWMNNSGWVPLSGSADSSCETGDLDSNGQDDAIFSFGTFGIWVWMNNSGWFKLHNDPAKSMVTGNLDGGQQPLATLANTAAQSMTQKLPAALENTAILPKP